MDNLNHALLEKLATTSVATFVSLLAPMERAGREVRQNKIRWKYMTKVARKRIKERDSFGLTPEQVEDFLQPATELIEDTYFWQHQKDGLAVFLGGDAPVTIQQPVSLDQNVVVGNTFYLRSLVDCLSKAVECHVLVVRLDKVRLMEVTGDQVRELQADCLPDNLREALNINNEHIHSTSRFAGGDSSDTVYDGRGGRDSVPKKKDELLQYFQRLSDALDDFYGRHPPPLVFAGVECLYPIFVEAYHPKKLLAEFNHGNPDELSPQEIAEKVRPILHAIARSKSDAAVISFQNKKHTVWASEDLADILRAARQGQVETFLFAPDYQAFGSVSDVFDASKPLVVSKTLGPGMTDVVNQIVVETYKAGGEVFSAAVKRLAGDISVGATFRAPIGRGS